MINDKHGNLTGILTLNEGRATYSVFTCKATHGLLEREKLRNGTFLGTVSTVVNLEVASADPSEIPWTSEPIAVVISLENLTGDQANIVHAMIGDQSVVLSKGAVDPGKAAVTKHLIELYDSTLIRQKPHCFLEPVVEAIQLQCQELQALDIIEPSKVHGLLQWYVFLRRMAASVSA